MPWTPAPFPRDLDRSRGRTTRAPVSRSLLILTALTLLPLARGDAAPRHWQGLSDTLLPWSLQERSWEIATGATFRSDALPPFTAEPEFVRNEWWGDLVDASYGLGGGAEFRLEAGVQHIDERGGTETWGVRDARLTLGYEFPSSARLTGSGFLRVKLPNASDAERLGTDQTDVALIAALGAASIRRGWAVNAGLGILGHPERPGVQDDVLIAGGLVWWRPAKGGIADVHAELNGTLGSRFGNDRAFLGYGLLFRSQPPIGISFGHGLTDESADWSVTLSIVLRDPMAE